MNPDKRFAKKLRTIIESARACAEKEFPGDRSSQSLFMVGWLESEAGMREKTYGNE